MAKKATKLLRDAVFEFRKNDIGKPWSWPGRVPLNKYTKKLAKMFPEWFKGVPGTSPTSQKSCNSFRSRSKERG